VGRGKPLAGVYTLCPSWSELGWLMVRGPLPMGVLVRLWGLAVAGGLMACIDGAPLGLPAPGQAQSLVFVAETEPESTVHITTLNPGVLALPQVPVTLMHYGFDLDSLGLGPLGPLSGAASELQSLPPPLRAFEMRRESSIQWSVLDVEQAPHASILVPRPDASACIDERGGCIALDAPWRCLQTCPEVRPEAPALPDMPCPPGWSALSPAGALGVQVCEPPLEDLHQCTAGEYQAGPGQACAPLAPCAAGPWPIAPEGAGALRYVAAGAMAGGDGSIDRPFGSLAQAVQEAPERATILLSAGTHAGGADFSNKTLRIQGLCADHTEIAGGAESALLATDASLTLSALRLSSQAPALVAMRGAVTLEGVSLSGQGPLLFAQAVRLNAQGLRTTSGSGGGLLIGEGSQVQLQGWDHAGPEGLSMHTGQLFVQGATLRGQSDAPGAEMTLEDVSTSTLTNIQVEDVPGMALAVLGAYRSVVVRDVSLRRCGTGLQITAEPVASAAEPAPQVKLTRIYGKTHPGKAIAVNGADVSADFISVHANRNDAISIRQQGPGRSSATINHLWASSAGTAVVEIGRTAETEIRGMDVTGEDWVVTSVADAESLFTILVRDEASVRLKRAWVRGARGAAIEAFCGNLDLEDLTVINGLDRGLTGQAPKNFRVHRAAFSGATDAALEATTFTARCAGSAPAEISNVYLQGCTDCALAMSARSGGHLRFSAGLIDGYMTAGLVSGNGVLEVNSSQVSNGRLGFDLNDRTQADGVVRGVRFDVGQSFRVAAP